MDFCRLDKSNGMFILTLTGGDSHHYLTDKAITELKDAIARVRSTEAETRGLVTTSDYGSFCDGIDYGWVSAAATAEESAARVMNLVQRMAEVVELLLDLPVPTVAAVRGDATSLGLALALAHDHCVVWKDAVLGLAEAKNGYRVPGYMVALVREKIAYARLRKQLVLKSQPCTGAELAKTWYSAHDALGDKDQVVTDAVKLLEAVEVGDLTVYAKARQMLYPQSWAATPGGTCVSAEDIPVLMNKKLNIPSKSAAAEVTAGQDDADPKLAEKSDMVEEEPVVDDEKPTHAGDLKRTPRVRINPYKVNAGWN